MDLPSDAGASLQHIPLGCGVPCPLGLPMGYVLSGIFLSCG